MLARQSWFTRTFFKPRQAPPLVWFLCGFGWLTLSTILLIAFIFSSDRIRPQKSQLVEVSGTVESVVERYRFRTNLRVFVFKLQEEPILFRYGRPNACCVRAVFEELQRPGAQVEIHFEGDLGGRSTATVLALSVNGRAYLTYEKSLANLERNRRIGRYALPVFVLVTAYSFLAGWYEYRRRLAFL